jgi:hypothetical protein
MIRKADWSGAKRNMKRSDRRARYPVGPGLACELAGVVVSEAKARLCEKLGKPGYVIFGKFPCRFQDKNEFQQMRKTRGTPAPPVPPELSLCDIDSIPGLGS